MFDVGLLISPRFWFSFGWNPLTDRTALLMAAAFGLLVAYGIIQIAVIAGRVSASDPLRATYLRRLGAPCIVAGVFGELLTFIAYQQIPILSSRFWFLFLFVGFAIWMAVLLRALAVKIPKLKAAAASRAQFEQYLPKRKKK